MMKSPEDPWADLQAPTAAGSVSARRVSSRMRWDFYWGRDTEACCMLILRHGGAANPGRLPRFHGLEVLDVQAHDGQQARLVLRLRESSLREVFAKLCEDILASAEDCATEGGAVATVVARTWRWHHLLRGGGAGILSLDDQKGLLGELHVLETYLLPSVGCVAAIEGWRGPLGAAQDFRTGSIAIESKAHGAASALVRISSEYQLSDSDLEALYLHVCAFDPTDGDHGFTLSEVAERVRELIRPSGDALVGRYEALLSAAGFLFNDDYSRWRWAGGERGIYHVRAGFPRITLPDLRPGVGHVSYSLALEDCAGFLVSPTELQNAFPGKQP